MTSGFNSPIDCNGAAYGKDLNVKSCVEAQKLIPTTDSPLKFGQRFRQGVDVPTPWRWVSTDGKCVIEVPETKLQSAPQGSYLDLSTAADDMVELCLEIIGWTKLENDVLPASSELSRLPILHRREEHGGDHEEDVGRERQKKFRSARAPRSSSGATDNVHFEWVTTSLAFYDSQMLTLHAANQLYSSQLVATVDLTTTNQDAATWYDIWAATAALDAICVRKGMAGSASWLGE
ncbi:MAG: hypothetical protein Q9203_005022 [Teloschistes exilis]